MKPHERPKPSGRSSEQLHRELYPEQYTDPLVGRRVRVYAWGRGNPPAEGRVERVFETRFGRLAVLEGDSLRAYPAGRCEPIDSEEKGGAA